MTRIVTDTTVGVPLEMLAERDIPVIPQIVIFGEESYRDDTELDTETFLKKLRASRTLPKTAAPPLQLYAPIFERLAPEQPIICLHPSTEVSGTVRSATVAAADFPDLDIRVVDTRSIAAPMAAMVFEADRWAREGVDADTIIARVHDMIARQKMYFLVDTLEYLHKGGRIGGAKALVGGLLQVKPLLTFRDGRVEALEQPRTHRRAVARLKELVVAECPPDPESHLALLHADAEEEAQVIARDLASELGLDEVPAYQVPPAIVVHGGPGILGAAFFTAPTD
jgi:DegV family protein with EDD domain